MGVDEDAGSSLNEVDAYILALVGSADATPVPGKLHLQKEMYLIQRAVPELRDQLDFEPYLLGPHSFVVEDEAQELANSSFLSLDARGYSLTERGLKVLSTVVRAIAPRVREQIEELKRLMNDLTTDELLAFIYFGFPSSEVERESAEYKRLLPRRLELARSLHRRGKVSAERGAEVGGVPLEDFFGSEAPAGENF